MENFEILVTSPIDKENLVAEIWYQEKLIAEINTETDKLMIEFYQADKSILDFNEFMYVLEKAKNKLSKR